MRKSWSIESPFPNGRWRIGVEVNTWNLKARGFQQVLSRTWSMQVCGSKHSSLKTSYTCILHLGTKRTRIFLLSISRARRGSLEKCAVPAICLSHISLSLSFSSLDASLTCSFLSFAARLQHAHCHTVGRKQISEGDACRNVSQLISCWRNMAVIKCAFSLYGMHSRGPLGSRNHRVAKLRLENISPWCATWPVVARIKWCAAYMICMHI